MKAFTLAAVLVASTVTAQTINGVDASSVNECLLQCATDAATGAGCQGITDTGCYCTSQDFLTAATSCINSQCPDQLTAAVGFQSQICTGGGESSGAASDAAASSTGDAAASSAAASATDAAASASSDAAAASSAGAAASSGAAAASSGAAAASSAGAAASSGAAAASSAANSTVSGNTTTPSASAPASAAVADFIGFKSIALAGLGAVAGAVFVL